MLQCLSNPLAYVLAKLASTRTITSLITPDVLRRTWYRVGISIQSHSSSYADFTATWTTWSRGSRRRIISFSLCVSRRHAINPSTSLLIHVTDSTVWLHTCTRLQCRTLQNVAEWRLYRRLVRNLVTELESMWRKRWDRAPDTLHLKVTIKSYLLVFLFSKTRRPLSYKPDYASSTCAYSKREGIDEVGHNRKTEVRSRRIRTGLFSNREGSCL